MSRVVVVGNGMAGCRFVQELLERDTGRRFEITVVGEESGGAYNRVLLSNVLAGTTRSDAIDLAPATWFAERGVTLHSGRSVRSIERARRAVVLDDGVPLPYDTLVLATGSSPLVPPIAGLRDPGGALLPGAALFRTREDCRAIAARAASARSAVVVGAGLLGLEAARALTGRGLRVTVVQREDRLMERQLDAAAGRVLERTMRGLGVEVRSGVTVSQVEGTERVTGVTLSDGLALAADLLVLCCGVRPRTGLAESCGLAVRSGVLVDDGMRTVTDPDVFAIGECAEHRGRLYGLVAPVWEQARVAAAVLADPASPARYTGSSPVTRLKAAGIELAAMGDTSPLDEPDDDEGTELVTFADRARGVYQKLVVRDGRLIAAILLGDTRNAGTVTQLFERGAVLPPDRSALLLVRRNAPATAAVSPTALPARATICQCNGVTKATIVAAWQSGARTVEELAATTRATTGCGTCRETVCGLVDWLAQADSGAPASA